MRDRSSNSPAKERGAALILFTLMLAIVLLPMIGLAIDGGVTYFAHARLSSAVDAAALAGARSLNIGQDPASQAANAQAIATRYFNANYPPGLLNSANISVTPDPPRVSSYHTITMHVRASSDVNLYFLGMLGQPTAHISAEATTSRRDVNVILAVDRSGSMAGVCEVMKADVENFVDRFVDGRDRVGLVTFMGSANTDYPATKQFKSQNPNLNSTVAQLKCGNNTGSAAALSLAHQQITAGAEPGALNIVVFFTDGVPNGFTAGSATPGGPKGFPLKPGKACNGNSVAAEGFISRDGGIYNPQPQLIASTAQQALPNCSNGSHAQLGQAYQYIPEADAWNDSASGYAAVTRDSTGHIIFSPDNSDAVSLNAADDAALKIRNEGIVIYAIGLGSNGGVDSTFLKRVANDPTSAQYNAQQPAGKYYYAPTAGQLGAAFQSIASEILRISQ
jgi:Flp pilus assembly protein TadG